MTLYTCGLKVLKTIKGQAIKSTLVTVLGLVGISLALGCSSPTPVPLPTYTPYPTLVSLPTYTPYPTLTPVPTFTPYPTYQPLPTLRPYPTHTPYPTYKPLPTQTPLPTHTPYPTNTPYPTLAALPTHTPYPTATPYPTQTPLPTYTPSPPTVIFATSQPMPTATPVPSPWVTTGIVVDRLTDEKSVTFVSKAVGHAGNYDPAMYQPTLRVHCSETEGEQVSVHWGGHSIPDNYYGRSVGTRFDSHPPTYESWRVADNRKSLISRDSEEFISQAIFAVRLYMEFEADGHEHYAEFPLLRLWDIMVSQIEFTSLCR